MPHALVNGVELYYELSGPTHAPVVAFSNSLGTTLEMWDPLVPYLRGRYRILRYDTRGHGRSQTRDEPSDMATLAADLAGLLETLGIEQCHIVGLSLGGMTAQALGINHPKLVGTLTLMATAAYMPSETSWNERAALVRKQGMAAIVDATMTRWFTPTFRDAQAGAEVRATFEKIDPAGYAVCCGAIGRMDLRPDLPQIVAPVLIVAGADDPATPVSAMEEIRAHVADAELVILPRAAHLLAVECPAAVASHLLGFLDRHQVTADAPGAVSFEVGLENRRSVLGESHVARSLGAGGAFASPWQDFITRIAWGEVWGDTRLPWKTRSLVTLSMMVALHREEEFKLHVRPAIKNGVSVDELQALLLQAAIYAGVPASNAAFRWVKEVLGDEFN